MRDNKTTRQKHEYCLKCKNREKYKQELSDLKSIVGQLVKKKIQPNQSVVARMHFLKKKIARMQ
jgi:hypothetical protein